MKDRRLGRFTVTDKLLLDAIDTGHGANLFHGAVPLDIERSWMTRNATITMWHPAFRQVPEGEIIPEYRATFRAGEVNPTWEEVKP